MLTFLELHNLDEMVRNRMDNMPLNHTCPLMDIDSYKQRKASMTLVLADQNKDMNMMN
jgi:hypothetical protein